MTPSTATTSEKEPTKTQQSRLQPQFETAKQPLLAWYFVFVFLGDRQGPR